MGYRQELVRRMSGFSNYAISLSIICILSGGITSFHQGLCSVGGASIGLGWPAGQPAGAGLRGDDGTGRLGLSDGRRALPLGLDSGRPRLGLGDRLVQSGRTGHRAGRRQCRHVSVRLPGDRPVVRLFAPTIFRAGPDCAADRRRRGDHRDAGRVQSPGHPRDDLAHRFQRLLDSGGRRRPHRRHAWFGSESRFQPSRHLDQLQRPSQASPRSGP